MFHGRNIAVVVVALWLVSMSFLSTHVTFQGNTVRSSLVHTPVARELKILTTSEWCESDPFRATVYFLWGHDAFSSLRLLSVACYQYEKRSR